MKNLRLLSFLFLICAFNCVVFGAGISNGDTSLMRFLPPVEETGGWEPVGEAEIASGEDLFLVINGGAEIYHEYGFKAAVFQTYRGEDGTSINLEIYEMKNETAAFGMYTFKTGDGGTEVGVGHDGWFESYYLNFWKGNFLVTVIGLGTEGSGLNGVESIARAVDAKLDVAAERPAIVSCLPRESLQPNGVTYLRGNLGLSNQYFFAGEDVFGLREGIVGRYSDHTVFVFQYDNAETAGTRFEHAKSYLGQSERFDGFSDRGDRFEFNDRQNRHLWITIDRVWIVAVVGRDNVDFDRVLGSLKLPAHRSD